MSRNLLAKSALALAAMVGVGSASAYVAGGVNFGNSNGLNHLELASIAETLITGNGQTLLGYGQVLAVNGAANYTTTPGESLYYTISYTSTGFSPTSVGFVNGVINIYRGTIAGNLLTDYTSVQNMTNIAALTPWVRLVGHGASCTTDFSYQICSGGSLTGATVSFLGAGLLDVDTSGAFGDANVAYTLNANGLLDLLGNPTDIAFTSSGNNAVLNPKDVTAGLAAGCQNGTAAAGAWCIQGTANLRGVAQIPEPGSLALAGASLLAMLGVSRRRSQKQG